MKIIKFECDNCLSCMYENGHCSKKADIERENLINIIASCNSKKQRKKWIIELSNSDVECTESQCTGCPIEEECIETLIGDNKYVDYTPECRKCFVTLSDSQACSGCNIYLEYNIGGCHETKH